MSKHHHRSSRESSEGENDRKKKHRRSKSKKMMKELLWKIVMGLVTIVHVIFDKVIDFILEIYWGEKKKCQAVPARDFVALSAVEIAAQIRKRQLKVYDVVSAYIDRMKEVNSSLNAVVDGPFEEALEEAKQIDTKIENGSITDTDFVERPFLGVPFTTKDSTAVKDKLQTLGLLSRAKSKAKEDAECVRLMKEAGAIIIATTNVPEVNKWMETRNLLIGQTNNPYDLRRSVGGSSGGEAALIAACGTAFGLGTDIGGSIRIPAFCCGIFGHKPTAGIVNTRGCTFRTGKETSTMVVAGPMARYATDLLPMFKVLVGPKNRTLLKLDEEVNVAQLKYYYIPENKEMLSSPVSKELQSTMFRVIEHISSVTGEKVTLAELPGIEKSSRMWRYWMTQEPADFNALLGNGVKLNPFVELAKKLVGYGEFTMAAIYSLIDAILPQENAKKIREITRLCDEELTNLLGEDGILIYHSSPQTAPFHYFPLFKFHNFHYWSLFNVLQVPATQVPLGLSSSGLPLGIQVVATRNRDRDCLAVAEMLEKEFGGWVPPFPRGS